ncbi:PRTRC system protein E [Acidithiobacillus ferrivorans]|uniref:PRTRC system protein E n=1 Tax=Acidithiobacillus ferrivorans TaxID=160808 RepID=A0A060URL2_9PROT|nr:PRTRC system protein E [Acidithiobacillus ferrivorans]CDQ09214.1 PRTRC system protein E [Acidithiobacillus ferrivorans]SMH64881.1 PRTRC system protein E [Acidithiobacillus ferrivorans]
MFKEIQQVMDDGVALMTITIARENDALRVNFIPKASGEGDLSATPLSLLGTAEELDAGFIEAIRSYRGTRKTIAEQVAQSKSEAEALAKEAAEKAKAKTTVKTDKPASSTAATKPSTSAPKAKAEPNVNADIGALF